MTKKMPVLIKFMVILFILGVVINVKNYPENLTGKWQQIIPVVSFLDHIVIGSVSIVALLSLMLVYLNFCKLCSREHVKIRKFIMNARIYYYLLLFNIYIAVINIILKVIGFCSFSSYSKIQLILPPPLLSLFWLIIVVYWYRSEGDYLKEVIRK
jgi:hypothetical protein